MQSEAVHIWRYELQSRGGLNARSGRRSFPGALIRLGSGFGCLHPWPELGDPPLEDLEAALAAGDESLQLVNRARACAREDGNARELGISLLRRNQRGVPRSHATIPEWAHGAVERAVERGFDRVKLKGGRDLAAEAGQLNEWAAEWPAVRWRIDFNATASPQAMAGFIERLSAGAVRQLDFLEDPFPYEAARWADFANVTGARLALDRGVADYGGGAGVLVWKPALEDGALPTGMAVAEGLEVVATSYLDHPVGQCFAAAEASFWENIGVCGLQTHEVFEPNEFSECLGPAGPEFRIPAGAGLGFDDILEGLTWTRLK